MEIVEDNMENYNSAVSISKIKTSTEEVVNSDKSLSVKANLTNNNTETLSILGGDIVAFKDDDIVAMYSFYQENVSAGGSFDVNAVFPPNNAGNKFDYDQIKVFVTSLAD